MGEQRHGIEQWLLSEGDFALTLPPARLTMAGDIFLGSHLVGAVLQASSG